MRTQLPSQKGGRAPPIFGPFLLWPNGWMHQDTTWYGGRPQPRRLCVQWGPSYPQKKGHTPTQFLAHVYCGQTAGWMKRPLDTEVDLGPGFPAICERGTAAPPPLFGPCLLWPWSPISATAELLYKFVGVKSKESEDGSPPIGVQGKAPIWAGNQVPQKLKHFKVCRTLFCP